MVMGTPLSRGFCWQQGSKHPWIRQSVELLWTYKWPVASNFIQIYSNNNKDFYLEISVTFGLEVFHNSVRNRRPTMTTAKLAEVLTNSIVANNND